ncbi:hypothetical protein Gpo141_00007735 [Globisporangium polare]
MDLSGFVRRFQSSSDAENVHQRQLNKPQGLSVDTSAAMKESQRMQPQWNSSSSSSSPTDNQNSGSPPGSGRTTPAATPTSTRSEDSEYYLRRRRSNSECLMLAKSRGGADLPGPCKEYIAGVKQILARSEETPAPPALLRRRSMSLKGSPVMSK